MNNYEWLKPRKRRRNLLIVEGKHEKSKLIRLLLKSYPEIDIDLDDIIVYGTNIYQLYDAIVDEYNVDWFDMDVDLPYIVGGKLNFDERLHKNDFMNILLIFDYERHDPYFSEDKINKLQLYFQDSTDAGKLYINYPMIESYQHLLSIPDAGYAERRVSVSLQPGYQYKNLVKNTPIAHLIDLPNKMREILTERFMIINQERCVELVEKMLLIHSMERNLSEQINDILGDALSSQNLLTAQFQMEDLIVKGKYACVGKNYYQYMRYIFNEIILHNIYKASRIQRDKYNVPSWEIKSFFEDIDFSDILSKQNLSSRDYENGMIWVINTSILFIPDYNFNLVSDHIL